MTQLFLDEVDATNQGYTWLKELGLKYGADRIEQFSGVGSGGVASAWKKNTLIGYFVVMRDMLNWSVLVTHDLTNIY